VLHNYSINPKVVDCVNYNFNQNICENLTCLGQEKIEEDVFFEATNEEEFEIEIETEVANDLKVGDILQFDFEIIRLATNNFSDANILGEGGFGIVYKVKILIIYPFF
jgi:hypothetical protein